jgi:hypothetical protein
MDRREVGWHPKPDWMRLRESINILPILGVEHDISSPFEYINASFSSQQQHVYLGDGGRIFPETDNQYQTTRCHSPEVHI